MACLFATAVAVALSGRGEGSVDISMSGWSRRASRGDAPVKLFLRCLSSSFVGQCDNGPEVGSWSDAQIAFLGRPLSAAANDHEGALNNGRFEVA